VVYIYRANGGVILCLKYVSHKTYARMEVELHICLKSTLNGGELSASRFGYFNLGARAEGALGSG
jgi:hypothetical protein